MLLIHTHIAYNSIYRYEPHIIIVSTYCRLIKTMCPESKIAQSMTCAATKCTQMSKVIGTEYHHQVVDVLRNQKFSLLIDESNSRKDPVLAVLVRYFCKAQKCSVTKFLVLLPCPCGTADAIFSLVDAFFR